jgi:type II secretion system protein N
MNYLIRFFRFIKINIGKIILTLLFFIVFTVFLFPLGDLSDFISSKVSTLTGNQVYLQFDQLHINPFSTSINMENVLIETKTIENLTIKNLNAAPSILALISKKPGGQLTAMGVLSGNALIKVNPASSKDKTDQQKSSVEFNLEKISLKDLRQTLNLSLPISGSLNVNAQALVDLAFAEQPDGDVSATIQKFELSGGNINLQDMGSLNLPEIKFSSVDLKSKFQAGKFVIDHMRLGLPADDLSGTIKGDLNLVIRNINGQMLPVVNGYNLSVDLIAKQSFKDRASFFLSFIDRFQSVDSTGTRYKFKLVSLSPGSPPQMTPLQ